jgi:uncharacterized RDD family membrane protein YckC
MIHGKMTVAEAIQILELSAPLTREEAKRAYREAMLVWHPDRFDAASGMRAKAETRTYKINEAFELLSRLPESAFPFCEAEETDSTKWHPDPPHAPEHPPKQPTKTDSTVSTKAQAWRRFWARLIDVGIARISIEILFWVLFVLTGFLPPYDTHPIPAYVGTFVAWLAFLISYEALLISMTGSTIGKWLFRIRVLQENGARLSITDAFKRTNGAVGNGLFYLVGYPGVTMGAILLSYRQFLKTNTTKWDSAINCTVTSERVHFFRSAVGMALGIAVFVGYILVREFAKQDARRDFAHGFDPEVVTDGPKNFFDQADTPLDANLFDKAGNAKPAAKDPVVKTDLLPSAPFKATPEQRSAAGEKDARDRIVVAGNFYNRSVTCNRDKDYAGAITALQEALRINPNFALALNNWADILANCPDARFRDGQRAITVAHSALSVFQMNPENQIQGSEGDVLTIILQTLSQAHAEAGNFNQAIEWGLKVLESQHLTIDGSIAMRKAIDLYRSKLNNRSSSPSVPTTHPEAPITAASSAESAPVNAFTENAPVDDVSARVKVAEESARISYLVTRLKDAPGDELLKRQYNNAVAAHKRWTQWNQLSNTERTSALQNGKKQYDAWRSRQKPATTVSDATLQLLEASAKQSLDLQSRLEPTIAIVKEIHKDSRDSSFVVIDAGHNRKIIPGTRFDLRRGGQVVGRITIGNTIEETEAIGDIDPQSVPAGVTIEAGDEVIKPNFR